MKLVVLFLFATACIAAASPSIIEIVVSNPTIIAETDAQELFNDAIRWSRKHELETGGCFSVYKVLGKNIIVTDANERVVWRRKHMVLLNCPVNSGIWHTHWQPEDTSKYAGCNPQRSADIRLIDQRRMLGLIICGEGRDSVVPYGYSAQADSAWEQYLRNHPIYADTLQQQADVRLTFGCKDEPAASRARPEVLVCK